MHAKCFSTGAKHGKAERQSQQRKEVAESMSGEHPSIPASQHASRMDGYLQERFLHVVQPTVIATSK
jgi:hypothetical protein